MSLLDDGNETGIAQLLQRECRTEQYTQYISLDNGAHVSCEKLRYCLAGTVRYMADRKLCQSATDDGKRAKCLESAAQKNAMSTPINTNNGCGFRYERIEQILRDDWAAVQAIKKKLDLEESRKRREEESRAQRLADAERRASKNPAYLLANQASGICGSYQKLDQAHQAMKQMKQLDAASGTANYTQRRQLTAAVLGLSQAVDEGEANYARLGGKLPSKERRTTAHWCSQRTPQVVMDELVRADLNNNPAPAASPVPVVAPITATPSSIPIPSTASPRSDQAAPPAQSSGSGIQCGSAEWKVFDDAVTAYCAKKAYGCSMVSPAFHSCKPEGGVSLDPIPVAGVMKSFFDYSFSSEDATFVTSFKGGNGKWHVAKIQVQGGEE